MRSTGERRWCGPADTDKVVGDESRALSQTCSVRMPVIASPGMDGRPGVNGDPWTDETVWTQQAISVGR